MLYVSTSHVRTTASMFEVTNGNSVDLPTTHINNTNLTSLFGDMSIQVRHQSIMLA